MSNSGLIDQTKITNSGLYIFKRQALLVTGIVIFIIFGLIENSFFTAANIVNIFRQISIISIMGCGMTYAIIGGNFDLSVGSLLSLCGAIVIITTNLLGPVMGVITAIAVGCCFGIVNGLLCGYLHLNSMVTTLGMMMVLQALTLMYTNGQSVALNDLEQTLTKVGQGYFPIFIMAIFCIIFGIILYKCVFGHYVKDVGTNMQTCRYSGISANKTIMLTFIASGFCTAVAAIILAMRQAGAQPTMGQGYEFDVITAVILGGADLSGGEGSIYHTFLGALIIGIMKSGFVIVGLSSYVQYVAECIIILIAVYMDIRSKKGDAS